MGNSFGGNTPAKPQSGQGERACFGAGCYWGTEKYFKSNKNGPSVSDGRVGFMGPEHAVENPSYKDVCSGRTGHVEVYEFAYAGDGDDEVSRRKAFRDLCMYFYQFHDPTTMNQQGNDTGPQYASVIYCYTDEQVAVAQQVKDELQKNLDGGKINFKVAYTGKTVTTDIRRATKFYPAHSEHQEYLMKNPNGYCNHRMRFMSWPYKPVAAWEDPWTNKGEDQ